MRAQHVDTVIIGGGQAGLATSWELTQRGLDHVVLERGDIAQRWRTAGWDSLRLLTPNWMSRLPGWSYRGDDPDGFLPAGEVVRYLRDYGDSFGAPVLTDTTVQTVRIADGRLLICTDSLSWSARNVVVATGACATPHIPDLATGLSPAIGQLTPAEYRNPAGLPDGGVLVVGASASGVQIAQELNHAGRRVTLSVGAHTRVPRTYRGMDIWWWLDLLGRLHRPSEGLDPSRARSEPSLQLVGRTDEDIDLGILAQDGVRITGRVIAAHGNRVEFAADLQRSTAVADARLRRLLHAIDSSVALHGLRAEVLDSAPYRPVVLPNSQQQLDLATAGIGTVIWATGYRPNYPWLQVPVLDPTAHIRQRGGLTAVPGLYAVGLRFGQRRSSTLLDGVRHDADAVVCHIVRGRSDDEVAPARMWAGA